VKEGRGREGGRRVNTSEWEPSSSPGCHRAISYTR
jgi:hypothetical protein